MSKRIKLIETVPSLILQTSVKQILDSNVNGLRSLGLTQFYLGRTNHENYNTLLTRFQNQNLHLIASTTSSANISKLNEIILHINAPRSFEISPLQQTLKRYAEISKRAHAQNIKVRAKIDFGLVCPYEGAVPFNRITHLLIEFLHTIHVDAVDFSDPTGHASPKHVEKFLELFPSGIDTAAHFSDHSGRAIDNIHVSLQHGVKSFYTSLVPNANLVTTEKVVYHLHRNGFDTRINEEKLLSLQD